MNIWSLFTNKSKGKSAPFLEQRLLKNALAKSNFALCFKALEWPNCNWHFLLYPRNFSISKRWNNCQLFSKNAWCGFGFFGCVIIILKNSCFWAFINNNLPSIVCIEIDSARVLKQKSETSTISFSKGQFPLLKPDFCWKIINFLEDFPVKKNF